MKKTLLSLLLFLLISVSPTPVFARSGCCSHHRGVRVDGCGCNDGTSLSSTCAPYYTCNSRDNTYIPVQQTQQVIYPTSTPIPVKVYVAPTNTLTPVPTLTIMPAIKSTKIPTRIKKATNKPIRVTPMPTFQKNWWQRLFGL